MPSTDVPPTDGARPDLPHMSSRLVVVGGDAAGMTAASHVRRARDDVDIVVIERGPYTSYSACGIPYMVAGSIDHAEDLVAKEPDAFRDMGITVHMETEAIAVETNATAPGGCVGVRNLKTGAEWEAPYDALLLATGAHPEVPDLPGLPEYGHVVHTLEEGQRLRRILDAAGDDVHDVVTVGAGYIGLEIAEALVERGLRSRVIDRSGQAMKTLDDDMADVVAAAMTHFGVELHLGENLLEVHGEADSCKEVITDKGRYPADTVVLAMGGKPTTSLATAAGCEIGDTGAVLVDERMRTTVPGIWAAGDLVESTDIVTGKKVYVPLGTHANKQGKVAGIDIAAFPGTGDAAFPGVVGTAVTRLCQLEIGRVGMTEAEAQEAGIDHAAVRFTGSARAGYMPDPGTVHVKMIAEAGTGRVLGTQLVGTGNVAKRIDVAAVWCQLHVSVKDAQLFDLSYAPPFGGTWDLLQVAARKLTKKLGLSPQL